MSDLDHDRDDHRPPPSLFLDIPLEIDPDSLLDKCPVDTLLVARLFERLTDHDPCSGQKITPLLADGQTALYQFGSRFEFTRRPVDGDDGNDNSIIGEMLSIANHEVIDAPKARIIDELLVL